MGDFRKRKNKKENAKPSKSVGESLGNTGGKAGTSWSPRNSGRDGRGDFELSVKTILQREISKFFSMALSSVSRAN